MDEIISKIIESQFATAWRLLPMPPKVHYQNVNFIQPMNGEWTRLNIMGGTSSRANLGPQWIERKNGIVMFQTFTPKNLGSRRAKAINDNIGNVFRDQQWGYDVSGNFMKSVGAITTRPTGASPAIFAIRFREPEEISTPDKTDYFQLNLRVQFIAEQLQS